MAPVDPDPITRAVGAIAAGLVGVGGLGGVIFAWVRAVGLAQKTALSQGQAWDAAYGRLMARIDQLTEDAEERQRRCDMEIAALKTQHAVERGEDRQRIRELEAEVYSLRRRLAELGGST